MNVWMLGLASVLAAPCEGPDVDAWVAEFRNRVESYDVLFRFAVERFGPPESCDGAVTMEFDGASFGSLLFEFAGGETFAAETMPPESSVVTLRAPGGLQGEGVVRAALEAYAEGMGLAIDWTTPEITTEGREVVHTHRDPDPGLNASTSLIFVGDVLVGVRLRMAL